MAHLVLAVDPSKQVLSSWKCGYSVDGCEEFLDKLLALTLKRVTYFKIQIAFFEQFGWRGIRVMEQLISKLKAERKVMILDTKRNDIHNTMLAYLRGYFELYDVDAVTISPYFGLKNIELSLDYAEKLKKQIFVVAVPSTSLQQKEDIFAASMRASVVYERIYEIVDSYNTKRGSEMGVVVGNSRYLPKSEMNLNLLIPGCITQGNEIEKNKKSLGALFERSFFVVGRYLIGEESMLLSRLEEIETLIAQPE
jgi:orotidine-5'-phosphate decarboxylase